MTQVFNNIEKIRESKGLSRLQLAKILNTSYLQIEGLETGERILSSYWIDAISKALNCKPLNLLNNFCNIYDEFLSSKLKNLVQISKEDFNYYSLVLPVLYPNHSKVEISVHKDLNTNLYEINDKGRTIFNLQYTLGLNKEEKSKVIKNILLNKSLCLTDVQDIIFHSGIQKENLDNTIILFANILSIKSNQIINELGSKQKLIQNQYINSNIQGNTR